MKLTFSDYLATLMLVIMLIAYFCFISMMTFKYSLLWALGIVPLAIFLQWISDGEDEENV